MKNPHIQSFDLLLRGFRLQADLIKIEFACSLFYWLDEMWLLIKQNWSLIMVNQLNACFVDKTDRAISEQAR